MAQYRVKMRVIVDSEISVRQAKDEGDAQAQAEKLAIKELHLMRTLKREPRSIEFAGRFVEKTATYFIEKIGERHDGV